MSDPGKLTLAEINEVLKASDCTRDVLAAVERIVAEREAAAREQGRAEADAVWAEVVESLAAEWEGWASQVSPPRVWNDAAKQLRALLTADHAKALDAVKVQAAQEALRVSADAARNMSDPTSAECAEWADWLDARADRLTTDGGA